LAKLNKNTNRNNSKNIKELWPHFCKILHFWHFKCLNAPLKIAKKNRPYIGDPAGRRRRVVPVEWPPSFPASPAPPEGVGPENVQKKENLLFTLQIRFNPLQNFQQKCIFLLGRKLFDKSFSTGRTK
jgi:hypothetical protein